jgi:hypothetical protein
MVEETESPATEESTAGESTDTTESQEQAQPQAGTEQGSEFAYNIPDGYEMSSDGQADFTKFLDDVNKLPEAERGQAMLDKHLSGLQDANGQTRADLAAMHQSWAEESMNDQEFGGSNLQENLIQARKTMNSFSTPAVDADGKAVLYQDGAMKGQQMTKIELVMNQTGMGNNPEVIRVFHRAGQALGEDHYVKGDMKPAERKKTAGEIMYPSMAK